jgi:hypothetical protein
VSQHSPEPIERVDPRDFLDPTARALAYLDLGDVDSARVVLGEISVARLRWLGEHYDLLSMICFELASAVHRKADNAVDPAAFRPTPDSEGIAEHRPGWPPASDYPLGPPPPAPVIGFDVDCLDELLEMRKLTDFISKKGSVVKSAPYVEFPSEYIEDGYVKDLHGLHHTKTDDNLPGIWELSDLSDGASDSDNEKDQP